MRSKDGPRRKKEKEKVSSVEKRADTKNCDISWLPGVRCCSEFLVSEPATISGIIAFAFGCLLKVLV